MLDKALITRADDFGSSHSANQAIYEVSKKGIVKNVSVMACAPYLEEAAEMLASSKDVTFGMHSVINCLLYTSPSPRDVEESRMPSSA